MTRLGATVPPCQKCSFSEQRRDDEFLTTFSLNNKIEMSFTFYKYIPS